MGLSTNYDLSVPASIDLQEIFDFSFEQFGEIQASIYYNHLVEKFDMLAQFPNSGIRRDDIRVGLKSIIHESHIIFYRIRNDRVFILRILHHSQDAPRHLKG